MPRSSSIRTAARLLDVFSAARIVMALADECPSSGTQSPCTVSIGSSRRSMTLAGVYPASSAAAYTKGLNADPGCRFAWSARLKLLFDEVAAADERPDFAGARVDRDERRLQLADRRLPRAALVEHAERALHFVVGGALHVEVDRRVDLEPALVHALFAEARDQLVPHGLLEVAAVRLVLPERVVQGDLGALRLRPACRRRSCPPRASPGGRGCGARPRAPCSRSGA